MKDRLFYVISLKLDDIAADLCAKNGITAVLADTRIEGDSLLLYLDPTRSEKVAGSALDKQDSDDAPIAGDLPATERTHSIRTLSKNRRRAKGKRNRMKTRGWPVVAKITNSNGLKVNIYKPFADRLRVAGMTRAAQRTTVANILKSNNNRPSPESIEYFLQNTLEYLKAAPSDGGPAGGDDNDSTS